MLSKHEQRKLIGKYWSEIDDKVKEKLMSNHNIYQKDPYSDMEAMGVSDGECIVDLTEYLSISGYVEDDEIIIDEQSKIYTPLAFGF